jgi:hypothetical protein
MTTLVPLSQGSPASPSFAFFVKDVGGWWAFKGIHVEQEKVLKLLERFKHTKNCQAVVVYDLNAPKTVVYEWST